MSPAPSPATPPRAPLGSWRRTYLAVALAAVLVMALLWWLTAHWNVPLGSAQ